MLFSCQQRDLQDRLHSWIPWQHQQTVLWPHLPWKSTWGELSAVHSRQQVLVPCAIVFACHGRQPLTTMHHLNTVLLAHPASRRCRTHSLQGCVDDTRVACPAAL